MLHAIIKPINAEVLHDWPLPMPSAAGDKEERGRILIIGGSREMPGAAILAATAALRAGAGKLTIASAASIAHAIALTIPESRVIGLAETGQGAIAPAAVQQLEAAAERADAILIGPGMQDEAATVELVLALLPKLGAQKIVLDAYAMNAVPHLTSGETALIPARPQSSWTRTETRLLITPHAGEMAHLTGTDKAAVVADPGNTARSAARRWNTMVTLKGATTYIASPYGPMWRHEGGNIGLAISGSGDTLAGLIAGLAARGATLDQAGAWGVTLHARAGEILAERFGPLGYLASEISAEIPRLMHAFGTR
jgi:ADP-dependent NAD(P)H-hydrate dehydratase